MKRQFFQYSLSLYFKLPCMKRHKLELNVRRSAFRNAVHVNVENVVLNQTSLPCVHDEKHKLLIRDKCNVFGQKLIY